MNWTKMSSIAEIISSIAILVTLGYLAVQTQQNTAALISDSRQQSLASELELLRMMVDYPEAGLPRRTPEEMRRIGVGLAMIRSREHLWLQVRDGQLDEGTFQSYLGPLIGMLQEEDRRQLWNSATGLEPGFKAFVDDLLAARATQNE